MVTGIIAKKVPKSLNSFRRANQHSGSKMPSAFWTKSVGCMSYLDVMSDWIKPQRHFLNIRTNIMLDPVAGQREPHRHQTRWRA